MVGGPGKEAIVLDVQAPKEDKVEKEEVITGSNPRRGMELEAPKNPTDNHRKETDRKELQLVEVENKDVIATIDISGESGNTTPGIPVEMAEVEDVVADDKTHVKVQERDLDINEISEVAVHANLEYEI